jgi:hypothetical protein
MHWERTIVVGVFDDPRHAQRCLAELRQAGFQDAELGVASPERNDVMPATSEAKDTYAEEGAVTGILAGAGLGAAWGIGIAAGVLPMIGPVIAGGTLAAIAASAAIGASAAGVAGALIGLGIPEDEASYYEEEFKAGRTLVTVRAGSRYDDAVAIIRRWNGHAQTRSGAFTRATFPMATGHRTHEMPIRRDDVVTEEPNVRNPL